MTDRTYETTITDRYDAYYEDKFNGDNSDPDLYFDEMTVWINTLSTQEKQDIIDRFGGENAVIEYLTEGFGEHAFTTIDGKIYCLMNDRAI
jgi:hypothetical protein